MNYLPKIPSNGDILPTDTKKVIRWSLIIILVFFGGFFLWAAFAPLKSGIVSPGVVKTVSYVQVIQSPITTTVKDILVHEGQEVNKDQVLLKLDDSQAKANYLKAENEYFYILGLIDRLQAQISSQGSITFSKELQQNSSDPVVQNLMQTQSQLFYSTMQNLQSQRSTVMNNISGLRAQQSAMILSRDSIKNQMDLLGQQIKSLEEVTKEGYYPKNQFLDKQRQYQDLDSNYQNAIGEINRINSQIAEDYSRMENLNSQFLQDSQSKLTEAQSQLPAAREQYLASKNIYESCSVKSPIAGNVLFLGVHTIGAVAGQGQELVQIQPDDSKFLIETQIAPKDIAKVHVGSEAYLLFVALNIHTTPELKGKVVYVSSDVLTNPKENTSYYMARVELSKEAVKALADKGIKPGMPVEVKIQAGAQTMLQYLVNPLLENLYHSFRE